MKEPAPIGMEEWLAAMEQLPSAAPTGDGMTTNEIAAKLGRGVNWVRIVLYPQLMAAGRLQHARAMRMQINGVMKRTDVYKLLPAPKAKR